MHSAKLVLLGYSSCILVASLVLAGCSKSESLPDGSQKYDLAPAGLAATISAPPGATVTAQSIEGVRLQWGDSLQTLDIDTRTVGSDSLDCKSQGSDCKIVETDATSVIHTYVTRSGTYYLVKTDQALGRTVLRCKAMTSKLELAKRFLAACKSLDGSGAVVSSAGASASASVAPVAATLEDVNVQEKTRLGPLNASIRIPQGWKRDSIPSGGVTFTEPGGGLIPINVSLNPWPNVKSLAQAEREFRALDLAGLDVIADKKELGPKLFQLRTAPRGQAKITIVYVFASGKKTAGVAKCYGPGSRAALMEEICSSLKME
jgi:hypothetical protein